MKLNKFLQPVIDTHKIRIAPSVYRKYIQDWLRYNQLSQHGPLSFNDAYPCLFDDTKSTSFDAHYLYQSVWAFRSLYERKPEVHVDIGSDSLFIGITTTIAKVLFVDIRPLKLGLTGYCPIHGDILSLPFGDNSVTSLSCMHVAEHIGLGRYGDKLDPQGTEKAMKEMQRVLAKGGYLYFSLPVGRPRICFNAHRIHAPAYVVSSFNELSLQEFSGIDDKGSFRMNIRPEDFENEKYACGLYLFTK